MRTNTTSAVVGIGTILSITLFVSTARADSIIGIANANIGITPLADAMQTGHGRFFLQYELNGNDDGVVFWIASDDPTGEPFSVSDGQITFIPGTYEHFSDGTPSEMLSIVNVGDVDFFSLGQDTFTFTLPSTVPAVRDPQWVLTGQGDEYWIYNVPVTVSDAPLIPEPGTVYLLAIGFLGFAVLRGSSSMQRKHATCKWWRASGTPG